MMKNEELAKKYFEIITTDFAGLNLTAHDSAEEIFEKQIIDSIEPFTSVKELDEKLKEAKLIIDIGFGGGFPIIPLSNTYKEKKFLGIEARKKKVDAVEAISKKLALNNAQFVAGRIEEFDFDVANTIVVNKAVGPVDRILNYINFSAPIGVIFYKGPNFFSNEESLIPKLPSCWKLEKIYEIPLLKMEKRYIIHFTGIPTENVPRRTKKLIKISTIVS